MGASLSLDWQRTGVGRVVYGSRGIETMDSLSLRMGTISQGQRLRSMLASHIARRNQGTHSSNKSMQCVREWRGCVLATQECTVFIPGIFGLLWLDTMTLDDCMRYASGTESTIFRNGRASQSTRGEYPRGADSFFAAGGQEGDCLLVAVSTSVCSTSCVCGRRVSDVRVSGLSMEGLTVGKRQIMNPRHNRIAHRKNEHNPSRQCPQTRFLPGKTGLPKWKQIHEPSTWIRRQDQR